MNRDGIVSGVYPVYGWAVVHLQIHSFVFLAVDKLLEWIAILEETFESLL